MFLHGLLRDSAHVLTAFYWTCEESLGTFILHLFNEVSNGTLRGSAEVQLAVFSRWQKPCWCSVAVATAEAKPSRYPSSSIPACARPSRSCLKSFSDSIRTNAFPSDGLCGREWRQAKQGALRRIALSSVRYVSVSCPDLTGLLHPLPLPFSRSRRLLGWRWGVEALDVGLQRAMKALSGAV